MTNVGLNSSAFGFSLNLGSSVEVVLEGVEAGAGGLIFSTGGKSTWACELFKEIDLFGVLEFDDETDEECVSTC